MSNIDRLKQCFVEALALGSDTKVEEMTYQAHASWDSVGHMRLVAAIETTFNIMFTTEQILDMSSFTKASEIVRIYGISLDA